MSVPYALYAEKAGNSSPTPTININAPNMIATPTTGVYNISVPSYSAGAGISISSGIIANTATSITPTLVAGSNMIVNPIGASNSYTVSSPNYSLSAPSSTSLLLSNGINNSTAIIPTQVLSLSGSTLTAGVPTNSVNLATLPSLWTIVSLTNIATTNSLSSVGIGTNSPTYKLTVISSATNAALYVKSTNASPISAQLIGDVIVSGKTLTDSISISGPGTPTAGSVLVSRDNLGNAKWSGPIMFKAIFTPASNITVNAAITTGIGGTANYSSSSPINFGSGLSISPANMIFTAPQTGYYNLNATMLVSIAPSSVGNAYVYLELYNNTTATTIARAHSNNSDATSPYYTTLQVNTIAQLTQGQQVILRAGGSITNSGTISAIYSPNLINQFSGNLIR